MHRRPDPRIAGAIHALLGDANTVLNVGAGTGSYEPTDRFVVAVEPSAVMRAQRPIGSPPVIAGIAEALPFRSHSFDSAMACVTIHHWQPAAAGLAEMRRVARGPVVVFTFDLDALPAWQLRYLHEALELERPRFGPVDDVARSLGGHTSVVALPTPRDCTDGFFEAFWARPEALLDPTVRSAQSIWALLPEGAEDRIIKRLADDLATGAWDSEFGYLREMDELDGALRLVVSYPSDEVYYPHV